jgi:hypothetical protein
MILLERPLPLAADVPATYAVYARRVLVPSDLSPIYPAVPHAAIVLALAAAAAAVALAATWRRLPGPARFAALAFLAALAPVSNVLPIYFRFADRYALLALAMMVPPLACALAELPRRWLAFAAPVVLVLATVTLVQSRAWIDSTVLFERAVRAQPDAVHARLKLGETYRDAHAWEPAVAQYQAAVRLAPDSPLGYAGLFYAYAVRAEAEGALATGRARAWIGALGRAMADPAAFRDLLADVGGTSCRPCRNTLLLLGLHRFPRADAELLAAARAALAAGQRDVALVYLSVARDSAEAAALRDAATRPSPR